MNCIKLPNWYIKGMILQIGYMIGHTQLTCKAARTIQGFKSTFLQLIYIISVNHLCQQLLCILKNQSEKNINSDIPFRESKM